MTVPDDCIPPEKDDREDEQLSPAALSVIEDLKNIRLYQPPPRLKEYVMTRIQKKKQSKSNE